MARRTWLTHILEVPLARNETLPVLVLVVDVESAGAFPHTSHPHHRQIVGLVEQRQIQSYSHCKTPRGQSKSRGMAKIDTCHKYCLGSGCQLLREGMNRLKPLPLSLGELGRASLSGDRQALSAENLRNGPRARCTTGDMGHVSSPDASFSVASAATLANVAAPSDVGSVPQMCMTSARA
jgi:hypothetical protein